MSHVLALTRRRSFVEGSKPARSGLGLKRNGTLMQPGDSNVKLEHSSPLVAAGTPPPRLAFLDSLRGCAALYVLMFHAALVPAYKMTLPPVIADVVLLGGSGVTLFFIVSAFSLAYTMPRHLLSDAPLISFYMSRAFRILPLFYLMIAFTIVLHFCVWGVATSPSDVVLNVVTTFNLVPGKQEGIVWASWTIGVEILFYLVFPVLYFRLPCTAGRAAAVIGAISVALLFRELVTLLQPQFETTRFLNFSIVTQFPVFLLGMLGLSVYEWLIEKPWRTWVGQGLLFAGVGSLAAVIGGWCVVLGSSQLYLIGFSYLLILVGISAWPTAVMVNSATRFLGTISYSIYLSHPPIVYFLGPVYQRIYSFTGVIELAFALCLAVSLIVILPIAWLLYTFIEKPGTRAGYAVYRRVVDRKKERRTARQSDGIAQELSGRGRAV